jgi:hypothetical protein
MCRYVVYSEAVDNGMDNLFYSLEVAKSNFDSERICDVISSYRRYHQGKAWISMFCVRAAGLIVATDSRL